MKNISIFISSLALFITFIVIEMILFKKEHKQNYSFFKMFPFELKSKKYPAFNIILWGILSIYIGLNCYNILSILYFDIYASFIVKTVAILALLVSILSLSLFLIDMRIYRIYILVSAIEIALIMGCFGLLGYYQISNLDRYSLITSIICFVICFILLMICLSPLFLKWSKAKKEEDNKEYIRPKFNILSFSIWVSILCQIFLQIIILF